MVCAYSLLVVCASALLVVCASCIASCVCLCIASGVCLCIASGVCLSALLVVPQCFERCVSFILVVVCASALLVM